MADGIQAFADWMSNEMVAAPPDYQFTIDEPRSQADMLGQNSEEFAYTSSVEEDRGWRNVGLFRALVQSDRFAVV